MGVLTPNGTFYKPDIGASGATEKGKFDDGLDTGDGLIESNKPANNKLSAFAPTTSAELAGVITDKIGAGKLRFDNSVTIITGAATLTPAQAGFIGVSASTGPYTLALPDPSGLKGLFFRIKKTDYNYNLITIAAVAGQFYYTNDQGTVKTVYNRLNTGGAEALFATDGINWYVFAEQPGQVPECRVYLSANQENIINNTWTIVELNTKDYDIGSNFSTDNHKFTVPINGRYTITGNAGFMTVAAAKRYFVAICVDSAIQAIVGYHSSNVDAFYGGTVTDKVTLSANHTVTLRAKGTTGDNTTDIKGDTSQTYFTAELIRKE